MSQAEINQLIAWTLQLRHIDTVIINPGLDSLIIWVAKPQGVQPPFDLQDYIDLANRVEHEMELEQVADAVYDQSDKLIQTGVRADKSTRPIKS